MIYLAMLASVAMVAIGLLALVDPDRFTKYTELKGSSPLGKAELRGAIGGMYLGLGLMALYSWQPTEELCLALGFGWLGVTAGKVVSIVKDKLDKQKATPGIAVDAVMAACFLLNAGI
jgi:hypothetical protein